MLMPAVENSVREGQEQSKGPCQQIRKNEVKHKLIA